MSCLVIKVLSGNIVLGHFVVESLLKVKFKCESCLKIVVLTLTVVELGDVSLHRPQELQLIFREEALLGKCLPCTGAPVHFPPNMMPFHLLIEAGEIN